MEADRSLFLLLLFREWHAFESSCGLLLNYNGILLQEGGAKHHVAKKKKTPWSSASPLTSKKQLFNTRVNIYMCICTFFLFPFPCPCGVM